MTCCTDAANALSNRVDATRRQFLLAPILACLALTDAEAAMFYKWLPMESAPEQYPAYLVKGELLFPDGRGVDIPQARNVFNGWGRRGSVHLVGPESKPAPARLQIAWFSYAENVFYGGAFPLPEQTIAKLLGTRIADNPASPTEFNRIIVGMAPEGVVSVWLSATFEVVEVANFQAAETKLPWEMVLNNPAIPRSVYVRKVLEGRLGADGVERLEKQGIPKGLFQSYRKQYRWRPWVTGIGVPERMQMRSFNGENAVIAKSGPVIPRDMRPVPSQILLDWKTPEGGSMYAEITFNEAEVFAAFRKLSQGDETRQLGLYLETNHSGVAASLRDQKFILPLEKIKVRLSRS